MGHRKELGEGGVLSLAIDFKQQSPQQQLKFNSSSRRVRSHLLYGISKGATH